MKWINGQANSEGITVQTKWVNIDILYRWAMTEWVAGSGKTVASKRFQKVLANPLCILPALPTSVANDVLIFIT